MRFILYYKSYCGHSQKSKTTLETKYPDMFDLHEITDDHQKHQSLIRETGQKTVPYVFLKCEKHKNLTFIGGNSEFQELIRSGHIDNLSEC